MHIHQKNLLLFIFVVSLLATGGSLYVGYRGDPFLNFQTGYWFNRLNGIPICDLCWYMRVFQYPLVFISGIALLLQDKKGVLYMWPLALIGLMISIYKWGIESGRIVESGICNSGISCATPTQLGGVVSLPLLGAGCFLVILVACFISLSQRYVKH